MARHHSRPRLLSVNQIVRTATSGLFLGYYQDLTKLTVTAAGVAITASNSSLLFGYNTIVSSDGNTALSGSGKLFDSGTMTLRADLSSAVDLQSGCPCVDALNQRAFLLFGHTLSAFNSVNGAPLGTFSVSTNQQGNWASTFVRWGLDGFEFLGNGTVYIGRWNAAMKPGFDANGNGIDDAWESNYLGAFGAHLSGDSDGDGIKEPFEYLFGLSPVSPNNNPAQTYLSTATGQARLHFTFPRRVGLTAGVYGFEVSPDLENWSPPQDLNEEILATEIIDGIQVQLIDASMLAPTPGQGFVRMKWIGP